MEQGKETYPYNLPVSFHFRVEISGFDDEMRFQEVGGLTAEMGVEELAVGGQNMYAYRLPTRVKYGNLVLKRGMIKDSKLIGWFNNAIENFEFSPADLTVTLLNADNEPVSFWAFIQAYPVKWVISDFNATGNALAIETIELAYINFRRDNKKHLENFKSQ